MYLFLDNTSDQEIIIKYSAPSGWIQKLFNGNEAGDLLKNVAAVLSELKFSPSAVQGIAVKIGSGRFTSTRIAVTLANTLAFALKISVVGTNEFDGEKILDKLKNTPVGQYILAEYSAEPHIGGKQTKP